MECAIVKKMLLVQLDVLFPQLSTKTEHEKREERESPSEERAGG